MITAREFPDLERLPFLTGHVTRDHMALYRRYVEEWNAIQERWPQVSWDRAPEALSLYPGRILELLDQPIASLDLAIDGQLKEAVDQVKGELVARGIRFFPGIALGEDEFFAYDRATNLNVPWYLANPALWWLVNDRHYRYTRDELVRVLRHEVAHTLNYAFELWKAWGWSETFGDFEQPYASAFAIDVASTDHVQHLHRSGPWQNSHYAQKHPDEDWAETFATWVTPGLDWRAQYPEGTGARKKLEAIDQWVNRDGVFSGWPTNRAAGKVKDWRSIEGTVRDFLGLDRADGWSDHAALSRREPEVLAAITLHELYFEALGRTPATMGPSFCAAATAAFGSLDSWAQDFRAICQASNGWALATWDPRLGKLHNALVRSHSEGIPPNAAIVLAVDCWEHSYAADYGIRKDLYLGGLLQYARWDLVESRFPFPLVGPEVAVAVPPAEPAP